MKQFLDSSINPHDIKDLIKLALLEDIGDGDHSTLACVPKEAISKAQLIVKQDGILAGVSIAKIIFDETAIQLGFAQLDFSSI